MDVQAMLDLALDFRAGVPTWLPIMLFVVLLGALAYITYTDAIAVDVDEDGEPRRDEQGYVLRRCIIPNHVTYPGILLSLALSPVLFDNWKMHWFFGVATFVVLCALSFAFGGGFGMGDTKLYTMAGLIVGPGVLLVIIIAALLGIVIGVAQAAIRRKSAVGHGIPHGPQIAAALVAVILLAAV